MSDPSFSVQQSALMDVPIRPSSYHLNHLQVFLHQLRDDPFLDSQTLMGSFGFKLARILFVDNA